MKIINLHNGLMDMAHQYIQSNNPRHNRKRKSSSCTRRQRIVIKLSRENIDPKKHLPGNRFTRLQRKMAVNTTHLKHYLQPTIARIFQTFVRRHTASGGKEKQGGAITTTLPLGAPTTDVASKPGTKQHAPKLNNNNAAALSASGHPHTISKKHMYKKIKVDLANI